MGLQPVLKLHAKVQLNSQILDIKSESEDLFLREALDRRNLLEALHVEVFLVAEDDHAVRLAYDILLLEVSDVLKCHVLERLIELLVGIVVESLQLGIEVSVEHIVLSGTHTLQALDEALLSQVECSLVLWQVVDDLVEHVDAVHHLVALRDDMSEEVFCVVLTTRAYIIRTCVVSQTSCLAKFLEDDGVHASAKVLIEESKDSQE